MSNSTAPLNTSGKLPALADHSLLRYLTFTVLYFAQGVPAGVLTVAFPAWMAMNGKSAGEIGSFIGVVMAPWSLKFIAGPLMDRYTYLPMGRRKPWVLVGQFGLVLGFLALSALKNPLDHLPLMMGIGFVISLFGIIQDVSIDSMAIDLLPDNQQARANGLMWGSRLFGKALIVAVATLMMNAIGYQWSILTFATVILLIMIVPVVLRERDGEKLLPWTKGQIAPEAALIQAHNWKAIFKNVVKVFLLPVSIYAALANFFFSIGEGYMDALLPVFSVQELGWTDTKFSSFYSITSMISGGLAMLIGGALIDFLGKRRMMLIYIFLLIVLVVSLLLLQNQWHQTWLIVTFYGVYYTLNVFTVVGIFAVAMSVSWKRIAATQFTLYMTIGNLGLAIGPKLMGVVKTHASWQQAMLLYIPFVALGALFVYFFNFKSHQTKLEALEAPYKNEE